MPSWLMPRSRSLKPISLIVELCKFFVVLGVTLLLTLAATSGLGKYSRILACFDFADNWRLAWKPVNPSQENRPVNGLRVLTAFSLIGVHVIWYKYFSVDPSVEMLGKLSSMTMRHTYWPTMVEIFLWSGEDGMRVSLDKK